MVPPPRPRSPRAALRAAALLLAAVTCAAAAPATASAPTTAPAAAPAAAPAVAVARLAGDDRVGTALAVARDRFPGGRGAAVLARSDDFADALAGAALADHVDGPLLLTGRAALDPRVGADLAAGLAPGSTVWLLGAGAALDDGVARAVEALGLRAQRLAGADRYATAAAVAAHVGRDGSPTCDAVLATGRAFADGAAASGHLSGDRPLLYTDGDRLPAATAAALASCAGAGEVTAVGGPAAAALAATALPAGQRSTAVAGRDRYETAALLLAHSRQRSGAGGPVVLTTGEDYADPLVGGTYGHPVLLTGRSGLPASAARALWALRGTVGAVLVVGGEASVPPDVARAAVDALTTEPAPEPAPEPAAPGTAAGPGAGPEQLRASWEAAWRTGDHEVLRAWFEAQRFGPDAVTGTHPGGAVRTQADADAMRGKRVTGATTVDGDVTITGVFFDGARVDVVGGDVTFSDVLHDARGSTASPAHLRVFEGRDRPVRVHFDRVEVRNGQDGVQTAATATTAEFVYVHSVAPSTGDLQGDRTHQDGWQHMRGTLDVQRSFVDYRGARTSVVMLKPDHGDVPSARINRTVLQGGGPILFHVHDAGTRTLGRVDLSRNLVAGTPGRTLASVWQVSPRVVEELRAQTVTASPGGQVLAIRDAAKLP